MVFYGHARINRKINVYKYNTLTTNGQRLDEVYIPRTTRSGERSDGIVRLELS